MRSEATETCPKSSVAPELIMFQADRAGQNKANASALLTAYMSPVRAEAERPFPAEWTLDQSEVR